MHPKFIVENGLIHLGKVNYHRNLSIVAKNVVGGGWWKWDRENEKLLLYSESQDFGRVSEKSLIEAIINSRGDKEEYTAGKSLLNNNIYFSDRSYPDWDNAKLICKKE